MAHQVVWTKQLVERFIEDACLSEEESAILRSRCKNETISQQSLKFNMSESKINKIVARLKVKYDALVREYPDVYPPRKMSAKETYLDTH